MYVCMYVKKSAICTVTEPLVTKISFLVRLQDQFLYFDTMYNFYGVKWLWPIYVEPSGHSDENRVCSLCFVNF